MYVNLLMIGASGLVNRYGHFEVRQREREGGEWRGGGGGDG